MLTVASLLLLLLAVSQAAVPVALNGYDVVECMMVHSDGRSACDAIGDKQYSTQYTSVDADGNPKFTSEFLFTSQANMLAFEVCVRYVVRWVSIFCDVLHCSGSHI